MFYLKTSYLIRLKNLEMLLIWSKKKTNLLIVELIHSDIYDGKIYFIIFIDDFLRYCYVYLASSKNELIVYNKFKTFKIKIKNYLERRIKVLRCKETVSILLMK